MPNYDSDKEYGKSAQCFKIYCIYVYVLELPIKAYYNAVSINDLTLSCIKCKTIKNKES